MLLTTKFNRTTLQNILKVKRIQGQEPTKGNIRTVYDLLISSCSDTNGTTFIRHQTIAKRVGISTATVKRCIRILSNWGLILVQHRKEEYSNNNKSNLYYICEMFDSKLLRALKVFVAKYATIRETKDFEEQRMKELAKINKDIEQELAENKKIQLNEDVKHETFNVEEYRKQQQAKREKNMELFKNNWGVQEQSRTKDQAKELGIKARELGIDLKRSKIDKLIEVYSFDEIYTALEITAEHNCSRAKYVKKVLHDKFKKDKNLNLIFT